MNNNLKIRAEEEVTTQELRDFDFERIEVSFEALRGYDKEGNRYRFENIVKDGMRIPLIITKDGIQYPNLKRDTPY